MKTHTKVLTLIAAGCMAATAQAQSRRSTVTITADNTVLDSSCRVMIPRGTVIADADGNGVIQIAADGITVEFVRGSVLLGAEPGTPGDQLAGVGIRLDGHTGVTIKNAAIHGYKVGMYASKADGLTVASADVSGNFRQHLGSTPEAEDAADWLRPHDNDNNEWMTRYGAGLYVEESAGVTITGVRCRNGQNGILLDTVTDSTVYDNDCSFLSGWGLGLWRSSRNTITRNAFDFCVRGHNEGVYNRGQDSAGILMFEQNNDNVIAENSATHGGDCFFGFAGAEALGDNTPPSPPTTTPKPDKAWYHRRGNTNNLLFGNDFSYASAHGIEMTFSFGNRFIKNRIVGNGICGVWGGYSQDTLIGANTFEDNGQLGYGLERGGVNIEHGRAIWIRNNSFKDNKCGVHLWWDNDASFFKKAWADANNPRGGPRKLPSIDNYIIENSFTGDDLVLQLRDADDTYYYSNIVTDVTREFEVSGESRLITTPGPPTTWAMPEYTSYGKSKPVGARRKLAGRRNIIMTEWGPWDHESPMVRFAGAGDNGGIVYEVFGTGGGASAKVESGDVKTAVEKGDRKDTAVPARVTIIGTRDGVVPYRVRIKGRRLDKIITGTFVATTWDAAFFPWTGHGDTPPADLDAWRRLADGPDAVHARIGAIDFAYGWGGPKDMNISPTITRKGPGGDYFGMIASTDLPLPAGSWRIKALSDDGVRVTVDGTPVIENWTHHGPTHNQGTFTLDADATVRIVIEHFEMQGYAVLRFEIEKAD